MVKKFCNYKHVWDVTFANEDKEAKCIICGFRLKGNRKIYKQKEVK